MATGVMTSERELDFFSTIYYLSPFEGINGTPYFAEVRCN